MSKFFEVGDRVVCVDSDYAPDLIEGAEYTVTHMPNNVPWLIWVKGSGDNYSIPYSPDRFIKVSEAVDGLVKGLQKAQDRVGKREE